MKGTLIHKTLIRYKKPSAIAAAVPTAIAFIVIMTVLVAVSVVLTSTGFVLAAMRQKSRRRNALSNRYMLPEGYVDFNRVVPYPKMTTEA